MTAEAPSAVSADDSPQSVVGAGERGPDPQRSDGAGAGTDGTSLPAADQPFSYLLPNAIPPAGEPDGGESPAAGGGPNGAVASNGTGVPTGAVSPTGGGTLNGNAARLNGADPAPDDPPATDGPGDTAVATSTDVTGTEPAAAAGTEAAAATGTEAADVTGTETAAASSAEAADATIAEPVQADAAPAADAQDAGDARSASHALDATRAESADPTPAELVHGTHAEPEEATRTGTADESAGSDDRGDASLADGPSDADPNDTTADTDTDTAEGVHHADGLTSLHEDRRHAYDGERAGTPAVDDAPAGEVVAAEVAEQLGTVVGPDVEAGPAEFAAAAVLDVLRASGWADAAEASELRAEATRLRELLAEVIRDHRAREASMAGVENQQLYWLVPLLRAAHGVAFGSLGAKVALRTAIQEVPPAILASAGLRIDYGVEPVYDEER